MKEHSENPTLDDVLNEFVADNEKPTAELLEVWVRRFPEYRRELVDFAAAWAEQLILPPTTELSAEEEEILVNRAMSHMLNAVFSRNTQVNSHSADEHPIDSLTGEAKKMDFSAQEFAQACRLDLALISKLNNRQIIPRSIPERLIDEIATLLKRSKEAVSAYLSGPPRTLAPRAFLARGKPHYAEQQTFADAVRASSLPCAEKQRWLEEAAGLEEE